MMMYKKKNEIILAARSVCMPGTSTILPSMSTLYAGLMVNWYDK